MKTDRQVNKLLVEMRELEAELAASRTLHALMSATAEALSATASVDDIIDKYFDPDGYPYDWGKEDLRPDDFRTLREYLHYIYGMEAAHD